MMLIGGGVCHQLPERSLQIAGRLLPVCARCTGIYIGFILVVLYFWAAKRWGGNKLLLGIQIPFAALSFLPFMIDGAGSYLGLWQSNNLVRILTGLPAGVGLPYFFILLKNLDIHTTGQVPVYKNFREQLGLMCAGFLIAIFVYAGGLGLYIPIALLVAVGVLSFIILLAGVLFRTIGKKTMQGRRLLYCQCIFAVAWIAGTGWMRFWLSK